MQSKQGALKESKLLVTMGITLGNIPGTAPGVKQLDFCWSLTNQLPRCLGPGAATFPGSSVTSLSQWPPYESLAGQLGDEHMPPGSWELEEYPKAAANAGLW